MTLDKAIEEILQEIGRPLTTDELASEVNTRGNYRKRDGSPVSAFQIHGRTRNYPQLFIRTGTTVSLNAWRGAEQTVRAAAELPTFMTSIVPPPLSSALSDSLFDTSAFRPARAIDAEVPPLPGLYAIRVRDQASLPAPFRQHSENRGHDLLYVGIARRSLRTRLLGQELRARGHGTFFRSVGAMLSYQPRPGSLVGKANQRNYSFSPEDRAAIIRWIDDNLLVNWVVFDGEHLQDESVLVRERLPLLNLQGNPAALTELRSLRESCVRIATTAAG